MKHKHYDMIVAKAANMELVVFVNTEEKKWRVSNCGSHFPSFYRDPEYQWFLCLPQHKEACLHWLNGGEVEDNYNGEWTSIKHCEWSEQTPFMWDDGFMIRIKPRKEKRWIGYNQKNNITTTTLYKSRDDVMNATVRHEEWQFIEIEVGI